jgi:hypothetical protein
MGDQPIARPLPTLGTRNKHNKRTQTYMPLVRFEPTVSELERAKTVHELDRTDTVIGNINIYCPQNLNLCKSTAIPVSGRRGL